MSKIFFYTLIILNFYSNVTFASNTLKRNLGQDEHTLQEEMPKKKPKISYSNDKNFLTIDETYLFQETGLATLDKGEDWIISKPSEDIMLTTSIYWKSKGVLSIKAKSIFFKQGSSIQSSGKGGLILNAETYKFEEDKMYIDFSSSQGAITIIYKSVEKHSDQQKTSSQKNFFNTSEDWEPFIKTSNMNYFKSFKMINNERDLPNILSPKLVNYAFNNMIPIDNKELPSNFKGIITFNGVKGALVQKSGTFIDWKEYPRDAFDYYFQHFINNNKRHHITFQTPPLLKPSRDIFFKVKRASTQNFIKFIKNHEGGDYLKYPFINNRGETILHFAIRRHRNKIAAFIFNNWPTSTFFLYKSELMAFKDFADRTPLQAALHFKNMPLFQDLYNKCCREGINISSEDLIPSIESIKEESEALCHSLKAFKNLPEKIDKYWWGFPNQKEGLDKEYHRQQKVIQKFFLKPPGCQKSIKILERFKQDYQKDAKEISCLGPYDITGLSSRSRIILMANILQIKVNRFNSEKQLSEEKKAYLSVQKKCEGSPYTAYEDKFPVKWKLGKHVYTFHNRPRPNKGKMGDTYLEGIPKHDDYIKFLHDLKESISSDFIWQNIHQSRYKGISVDKSDLGKVPSRDDDIKKIDEISLLMDLEVVMRLYSPQEKEERSKYDSLPIAAGYARMECLLKEGLLDQHSKLFYVDTANLRQQALKDMNISYQKLFTSSIPKNREWLKSFPLGFIVPTREQLHQEFLNCYGGHYESDGEEYETDNENES